MVTPFRHILTIGTVVLASWMAMASSLRAQDLRAQDRQATTVRTAGTVANVFETLDPDQSLDGIRVTIPKEWTLEEVRLLRYGTESIPVRRQRSSKPGTHLFTVGSPLKGPHDLLLRIRLPDEPGTFEWRLHALARKESVPDSVKRPRFRVVDRRRHELTVKQSSPPDRTNMALSLTDASEPLLLRADLLPALGRASSFTIEFWMRTNGLGETVLSTWNGNEMVAYPAEFVVDRGGRLRYYTGQPGKHRALRTGRPVADDAWHHVAAIYDSRRSRLLLLLDGQRVDSLRGHFMPPAPGPIPVAVGGRMQRGRAAGETSSPLFSGRLDELRIWGEARSVDVVRRMKSRPFQPPKNGKRERRLVRLGFDEEEETPEVAQQWPEGARRVPATLSFQSPIQNLQAQPEGRTVTLQWAAETSDVQRFVVERSKNGQTFTTIAELTPSDARRASVSDRPTFVYTDETVTGQVVFYRIRMTRTNGIERTSGTIKIGLGPKAQKQTPVKLIGNFPNPFSKTTTIAYEVNEPRPVTITVWDLQGHQIAELVTGKKGTGYHETPFEATDLPSGTYFVKLQTPSGTQTHRMVVLK